MVAGNEMQAVLGGELPGMFAGFLVVVAKLDEVCALGSHRGVFLHAVAMWDDDSDGNVEALSGQRDRLAVVSAGCGDESFNYGCVLKKFCRIGDGGAGLVSARRSVVLMLDPDVGLESLIQQRPGNLRGGLHHCVDELLSFTDFVEGGEEGEGGEHGET